MTVILNIRKFATYRRLLMLLLVTLISTAFTADDAIQPNLHQIRKLLVTALDSKKVTDSLYNNLTNIKDRQPLLNGYIGTLQALKAKHAWNPYFKIKHLNDSEKTFKEAVSHDPHNIEIRFMRFSIEHNVPGFLGFNKNLVTDRQEIVRQIENKNYSSADKALLKTIIDFLIDSKRCTSAENSMLKQTLSSL